MTNKLTVTIDSREQSRIESATEYYTRQGLTVEVKEEQIGDYIFQDQVVFEFKTIPDFIASIQSGRVFNQAINQAENYDYHYVVIQGDEHTRAKCLGMSRNWRTVNIFQYIGAISSLNRYTTVIESYNPYIEEAYYRMLSTATKCLSSKPIVRKFPRKTKNNAFNWLCYCNYGISAKKATAIVETLDLHTLNDLQKITVEELLTVDGIGKKNAENIIEGLK